MNAIAYQISLHNPNAHLFKVRCTVPNPTAGGQQFSLPAWIPGSYLIRDFARHIVELSASNADGALAIEKLDKQTWQAAASSSAITLEYSVYAFDRSVRAAFFSAERGFFNNSSLLLEAIGQRELRCELELVGNPSLSHWQVATGMPAVSVDANGFGHYRADSYVALLDYPFEMGTLQRIKFSVYERPYELVLNPPQDCDEVRLANDLAVICKSQIDLFGTASPMQEYLFLTQVTNADYGGLEHCNSTALVCSRNDLPQVGEPVNTEPYRNFMGLCSHEFFHCWNVKRIRPAAFADDNLSTEQYSGLLWWFEGVTSYYDDLMLLRTGRISRNEYLTAITKTINRVQRGKGRLLQPVFDSSFDAWSKFYKQDENASNAIVSYYGKGCLVTLCLDLTLRKRSAGKICMDDLLRLVWQEHGLTGIGVPEHGIQPLAERILGESLEDFFQRYVYGVDELPLESLLSDVGLTLASRPKTNHKDFGNVLTQSSAKALVEQARPTYGFGANLSPQGEAKVVSVSNDSPAEVAGLAAGDSIIAVNGQRVSSQNFDSELQRCKGPSSELHVFRDSRLLQLQMPLQPAANDTVDIVLPESDNNALDAWLSVN